MKKKNLERRNFNKLKKGKRKIWVNKVEIRYIENCSNKKKEDERDDSFNRYKRRGK